MEDKMKDTPLNDEDLEKVAGGELCSLGLEKPHVTMPELPKRGRTGVDSDPDDSEIGREHPRPRLL